MRIFATAKLRPATYSDYLLINKFEKDQNCLGLGRYLPIWDLCPLCHQLCLDQSLSTDRYSLWPLLSFFGESAWLAREKSELQPKCLATRSLAQLTQLSSPESPRQPQRQMDFNESCRRSLCSPFLGVKEHPSVMSYDVRFLFPSTKYVRFVPPQFEDLFDIPLPLL